MNPKWSTRFELKPGRWVFVPTDEAAALGKQIKKSLEERWKPPSYYYHLREGGHVAALKAHVAHKTFLHLDIQNFFGSINRTRVTRCLKPVVGYKLAREWATESTVLDPANPDRSMIPYGFIQSQILASMCLRESALGRCLHKIQVSSKAEVSVYVDDIIVSTNDENVPDLHGRIKTAAARAAFALNAEKEQGPATEVRAFNVRLSSGLLAVTEDRLGRFIEALTDPDASEPKRQAIIAYIKSINAAQASAI